jgi:protein TonB
MFTESLCDSSFDHRSRRLTRLVSFGLQALAVSVLLALPFLSTKNLPELSFATHLMVPMTQAAVTAGPVQQQEASAATNIVAVHVLAAPDHIPHGVSQTDENEAAPPSLNIGNANREGSGNPLGVLTSTGDVGSVPILAQAPVSHLVVSVMMEGNLVHRVQPQYPTIAMETHTQGAVVLHAVISREGDIENLQVISGHPMLVKAAVDAVRQWHYKPYYLNHQPVEVETQITVNFTLGG